MREVSSVFAEAEANNLVIAARALDPNDPTPAELVVLPEASVIVNGSARTAEEAREEVFASIRAKQENPTVLGTSSAAASAALGTAPEDAEGQETDEDRQRAEFKEEAATAHEERLRAARDQETAAPVATTSSTPSAETPKAAPASSPTGTDPKSDTASPTAAARKPAAGTPKK
jgi:hypothetical protein